MRRVVVTGMGIVSCLGNDAATVTEALRNGRSGIRFSDEYAERGLRSQIAGQPDIDLEAAIPRRARRFMGDAAGFAYVAMQQAIDQAELPDSVVSNPRTGLIVGSGGASTENVVRSADILRERGVRKIGAFAVPKVMGSTTSACLATPFAIKGINYSISSACATSAHCIGAAMEQIQLGKQDVMFAGGGEEEHWSLTMLFDAMGALSTGYNDTPERASRPFDRDRDGFVIAGGGGMLVLESLEHAEARGATILAELVGYAATSDGYDMVAPSGEGAERCLGQTLEMAGINADRPVDYVNAHGTSTPAGDITELRALETVFGADRPPVSSTKSLTGHSLGAAGVQEAIYSLLMMQAGFIAGTLNVDHLDAEAGDYPVVTETLENRRLDRVVSNSFGFGGTNASLAFERFS
ncbi:beta-ketoacyl-[acyl-carrier-protein] synthase I [Spiribacter sp. SSL99]|uniref:beta-ketoacyl-ACP synthase I n=1 Tax=Spiribacter sp. SSL99 TaxID=1866884 RepID=UPI00133089CB|nr:beta-ketoacyl-ACP synthase I [Spiribacter sp. SSL99]KAF0285931.1 beta-ketoacyl-[acyl-carrier-protein] synthase I [Spiribacter sp. SSL99]